MQFEITLNNLLFYAYHGLLEEERKNGNEFKVSLSVFIPVAENFSDDVLDDTISYVDLYSIINEEMQSPRNLLETLALEIVKKIKQRFPIILRGKIEIEKVRPPIPGMLGSASVALFF